MILGIVGSEKAKFTPETELKARQVIRELIQSLPPMSAVCSGECHLGGIDIWAHEEADILEVPFIPFAPKKLQWEGGYKQRNIQIAKTSDKVVCITVRDYPPNYDGEMRFTRCYHCDTDQHVKSGGCWVLKYVKSLGKESQLIVIGE